MKITMYELLGLVKDDKAPEKIKYKNFVYGWVQKYKIYTRYDITGKDLYITTNNLNEDVEIIEETKKIEKIPLPSFDEFKRMSAEERYVVTAKEYDLLDELIDEINNLKEK